MLGGATTGVAIGIFEDGTVAEEDELSDDGGGVC